MATGRRGKEESSPVRVAVLTGGGDCPGLNPAIRGIVLRGFAHGFEFVGIEEGWRGLVEGMTSPLDLDRVDEIISQGGTILGSSRTNPFKKASREEIDRVVAKFRDLNCDALAALEGEDDFKDVVKLLKNLAGLRCDALVALGGEDTLGVANRLHQLGVAAVGVPKTMDNDLSCTDYTFGFDSAVSVAVDAADRLRDTARSHRRIMVLEVMGRHAGWVALNTGIAAGADWILIPEVPVDLDEMCAHLAAVRQRGKCYGLVVASEGIELPMGDAEEMEVDAFGHVTLKERRVGEFLASQIERQTGLETRSVTLGHVQRGGSPTAFDRVLATRVGIFAADLVHNRQFGMMAAISGNEVKVVPLQAAVERLKRVPVELYDTMKTLFER